MNPDKRPDLRLVPPRNGDDAPGLPLPDEQRHDELEVRPEREVESAVIDGEIVSDKPERSSRLPSVVVDRVTVLREPETRKRVAKAAGRHGVTVLQGWHSWWVRAWDGLTLGVYRRQIRLAEETGDREALAEWTERKQQAVKERRERLMELPRLALSLLKVGCGLVALLAILVPVVALLVWMTGGDGTAVFEWVGGMLRWLFNAIALMWAPFLIAVPIVLVAAGWREGRRKGAVAPQWLGASDTGDGDGARRDVIPDEAAILNALRDLELAPLTKAFKAGWRPRFVLPTERDGNGYHTQVELPPAVTVEMINLKKKVLAHNLVRFPVEVWATEPRDKPGVLDLLVLDQGAVTGPVPAWPLLKNGVGDYFRGVPVAVDIRGKTVLGRLFEANYAIAGMMGSGKSTLIITLLLGALLDPLVDADVFVMAENADYEPMKRRLRTLRTGAGSDVVEACMAALRDAYNDLSVRGKALREHDARAVTRELAEKDARLRPRVFVIDECQALFMHEEFGDEAAEIAVKLESAARKYAVTLIYATPEPSTDSLPRRLIAITSNKACFAIGDQRSNDAILGTGSYKAGISAVGLEPKTDEGPGDVGTFMARGFTPKPSLLRGHYVSQSDSHLVVDRAMRIREKAGIGAASTTAVQHRDVLDDLAEVLDNERVRLSDAVSLLRKLAPSWPPYQNLTGNQLRDILVREHSVRVTNTGNVLRLDPQDLRSVLARREAGE